MSKIEKLREERKEEIDKEGYHIIDNIFEFLVVNFKGFHELHKKAEDAKTLTEVRDILKETLFGVRELHGALLEVFAKEELKKDNNKREYIT